VIEGWLKALQPNTFSLEQAPGLLQLQEHRAYFRTVVHMALSCGYNVRWRIQDQAWFGIAQHRRRLIFVGAKVGRPLPPFPAPIHGPPGSGLQPFCTIKDALRLTETEPQRFSDDQYHQPHKMRRLDKQAVDPQTSMASCVTTEGGHSHHYSGTRNNTVRELAAFQGFPADYQFAGSVRDARRQCGNAWPVAANRHYFAVWAAHEEAFEHGLLDAEDEVLDLYSFLEQKGIAIPTPRGKTQPGQPRQFRYLPHLPRPIEPNFPLPLWTRNTQDKAWPAEEDTLECEAGEPSSSVMELMESWCGKRTRTDAFEAWLLEGIFPEEDTPRKKQRRPEHA
jgi:DNA (cytosine-5)-methyltransferase 1